MLKEIPELDHEDPKYKDKEVVMEEARSEVAFKTGLAGFHITLFFHNFNKMIMEKQHGVEVQDPTQPKSLDKMC